MFDLSPNKETLQVEDIFQMKNFYRNDGEWDRRFSYVSHSTCNRLCGHLNKNEIQYCRSNCYSKQRDEWYRKLHRVINYFMHSIYLINLFILYKCNYYNIISGKQIQCIIRMR